MAKLLVHSLQFRLNELFCMAIKDHCPMKQACSLFDHHRLGLVIAPENLSDCIKIGLSIASHKSREIDILYAVLLHNKEHRSLHFFLVLCHLRLHMTYIDGHNFTMHIVTHMNSKSCPTANLLHMVKHDELQCKVAPRLHPSH